MEKAHWIRHTHVFRKDEYVCSVCKRTVPKPGRFCPYCGSKMDGTKTDVNWVDEMEAADSIFHD